MKRRRKKRWTNWGHTYDYQDYIELYGQSNQYQVNLEEARQIVEAMLLRNADYESQDFDMFTAKQANALLKLLEICSNRTRALTSQ